MMSSESVDKLLVCAIDNVSFMFNVLHYEIKYILHTYGVDGIHNVLVSLLNALETLHFNLDEIQKLLANTETNDGITFEPCKYLTVKTSKTPLVANYFSKTRNQRALKEHIKYKNLRLKTYFYNYTNSLISERLWKYMNDDNKSKFAQGLLFFCLDHILSTMERNTQCADQYRSILNLYGAFLFCHWYPNKKNVVLNEILFLKSRDGLSDPLRSKLKCPFQYVFVNYLHCKDKQSRMHQKESDFSCTQSDVIQIKDYSQSSILTWTPTFVLKYFNKNFYYRPSDFEDLTESILNMPSSSNGFPFNIGPENHLSEEELKSNDLLLDWNFIERRYPYLDHKEMASTSTGLYDWRRCYERFANVLIPRSSILLRNQWKRTQTAKSNAGNHPSLIRRLFRM